ncbi:MAG: ATP-binding protein [Rhodospirillales bacterium]
MTRIIPQTIFGRTVGVLLVGLVVSHMISLFIYSSDRRTTLSAEHGDRIARRVAAVVQVVGETPKESRPVLVRNLSGPGFGITWTAESAVKKGGWGWRAGPLRAALEGYLGDQVSKRVRIAYSKINASGQAGGMDSSDPMGAMRGHMSHMKERWPVMFRSPRMSRLAENWHENRILQLSYRLGDRSWINFAVPSVRLTPFWTSRMFFSVVLMTVAVTGLSVWAVRRSMAPLAMFARAAERLGLDVNAPALPVEGPREVRRAAGAFNEMQGRLKSFVHNRTQMLAAISHDLRTPITRLKLRAEFVDDAEQRKKMLVDLDQMEAMIASTLSFARDDAAGEAAREFDLAALLRDSCEAAADTGMDAAYSGPDKFPFTGRPLALKRAVGNLIDNAVKYGGSARVTLEGSGEGVSVTVDDDGPGLPEGELEKVFDPFYRGDAARGLDGGGSGLGLSVVRSIVQAHGGEVRLSNLAGGGLKAAVKLPVTPPKGG